MNKKVTIGVFICTLIVAIRFFGGTYQHDEFPEKHFFIKYRPIWKWSFYSPIGMSDLKMVDLTEEEQTEQKYFNEFIKEQDLSQ